MVLLAHSMGNRVTQYFLQWILDQPELGQEWIDVNIHAFFALGPPFLGATKCVRAVVSGDCMGLEVFLTAEEGRQMARGSASLPFLFPLREDYFPDTVAHLRTNGDSEEPQQSKRMSIFATKKPFNQAIASETYQEMSVDDIVSLASPVSSRFLQYLPELTFPSSQTAFWGPSIETIICTWTRQGLIHRLVASHPSFVLLLWRTCGHCTASTWTLKCLITSNLIRHSQTAMFLTQQRTNTPTRRLLVSIRGVSASVAVSGRKERPHSFILTHK